MVLLYDIQQVCMLMKPQSERLQLIPFVFQQASILDMPPEFWVIGTWKNVSSCSSFCVILTMGDFTQCSFLMCCSSRIAHSQAFIPWRPLLLYMPQKCPGKKNEKKYSETFREEESTNTWHVAFCLENTGVCEGQNLTFCLSFSSSPKTVVPACLSPSSFQLYTSMIVTKAFC